MVFTGSVQKTARYVLAVTNRYGLASALLFRLSTPDAGIKILFGWFILTA